MSVQLEASRWFQRGWTLQELIAPATVELFGNQWSQLGDCISLSERIASIRLIDQTLLRRDPGRFISNLLATVGVSTRLSWASNQLTTRDEDRT